MNADCRTISVTLGCKNAAASIARPAAIPQVVRKRTRENIAKKPRISVTPELATTIQARERIKRPSPLGGPARLKRR